MKNRHAGMLIIGIALLIGFLIWLFNNTLSRIVNESCTHGSSCAMWDSIRFQTGVGLGLLGFVLIIGIYIAFFAKDQVAVKEVHRVKIVKEKDSKNPEEEKKEREDRIKKASELLEGEEKEIFLKIAVADGAVFQSSLIKETGFSKVKITRILDRLEGKGLIERKRRGMTNIVLLKH